MGYWIQIAFYQNFPNNRKEFNERFMIDCYHIIHFELSGFIINDAYIYACISRYFNSKFLFYIEDENKLLNST